MYMLQLRIEIADYSGMAKVFLPFYCKAAFHLISVHRCVLIFEAKQRPFVLKLHMYSRPSNISWWCSRRKPFWMIMASAGVFTTYEYATNLTTIFAHVLILSATVRVFTR